MARSRPKQSRWDKIWNVVLLIMIFLMMMAAVFGPEEKADAQPMAPKAIGAPFALKTPSVSGPGTVRFGGTATYTVVVGGMASRTLRDVQMSIPAFQLRGGKHPRLRKRGDELVADLPPILRGRLQSYTFTIVVPQRPTNGGNDIQLCFNVVLNFKGDQNRVTLGGLCSAPR